jgi:hypothetical protein
VKSRHDDGDQVEEVTVTAISVVTPFLVYSSGVTSASRTRWSWPCGRGGGLR